MIASAVLRRLGVPATLVIAAMVAACTAAEPTASPQASTSAATPLPGDSASPSQPTAATPSATTPAAQPSEGGAEDTPLSFETEVIFGPGTVNVPDPTVGLDALSGYKATLTATFNGTVAGQPSQWTKTSVMLANAEPAARQLTIEKTGALPDLEPVVMSEMQQVDYTLTGDEECTAQSVVEGSSLGDRLEPAGYLPAVIGADDAGSEPINGVAANHATFDQRAFGQGDASTSTGEMWVATDGGQILRYLVSTQGDENSFGEGVAGTLSLTYELTDINQPMTITLDPACPAGRVSVATLPDATDVIDVPGLLSFTTSSSVADAVAFYQQQLPTLGWLAADDPIVADDAAWLDFSQAGEHLTVAITSGDGSTFVDIALVNE